MKTIYKILCLSVTMAVANPLMAQQNVGIGTSSPDNSAVLDIQSSAKGLLIPRMSLEKRNAILSPADGLMIYQTGEESGFFYFKGKSSQWLPLSETEAKSVAGVDGDWTTSGNVATAGDFIGTTNAVDLEFKVNSARAGLIEQNSNANTFFGYLAGNGVTGVSNTAIGGRALENGVGGNYNTAIGGYALRAATGNDNLAIGLASMMNVTNAAGNTAIGNFSLSTLVAGSGGSPRKNFNTAIGVNALQFMTNGESNTAISSNAMKNFQSGNGNVAIGNGTLANLLNGNGVTGIGSEAGLNATGTGNTFIGYQAGYNETGSDKLYISNSLTTTPLIYGDFSAKFVSIGDVDAGLKREDAVTAGGYKLLVQGGILTEKVKVALKSSGDWADYVFEKGYNLVPLEEVEKFTIENKHLPNVPSADEMVKNGIDVNETSKMFMEKIEELTLYIIEMNKEVKGLRQELDSLKN